MPASFVAPHHFGLFAGAEPVRKIAPRTGRKTMPGWFPSSKGTLASLRTETKLELDGLEHFEVDPDVVLMATQPHQLVYWEYAQGTSIRRSYVPDLAMQLRDGTICVVDFKIEKYASREPWRSKALLLENCYRLDHGAHFRTITEHEVYAEPTLRNVKILMMHRPIAEDAEAILAIERAAANLGLPRSIDDLCRAADVNGRDPGVDRAFSAALGLVVTGRFAIDMRIPLTRSSLLFTPGLTERPQ